MQSPDQIIITASPTGTALDRRLVLAADHPSATTFCLLSVEPLVVLVSKRPHKFIYNALVLCAKEPDQKRWRSVLEDYDSSVFAGKLTGSLLAEFQRLYTKDSGFPRYSTVSGRVWLGLSKTEIGSFGVIAFWNDNREEEPGMIALVRKLFQLNSPAFVSWKSYGEWI